MKIIEYYLNLKPNIMMSFGFILIIFIGFLGEYFSWARIPYQPLSNIIGGIIFITGWLFHKYCHSFHKKSPFKLRPNQEHYKVRSICYHSSSNVFKLNSNVFRYKHDLGNYLNVYSLYCLFLIYYYNCNKGRNLFIK